MDQMLAGIKDAWDAFMKLDYKKLATTYVTVIDYGEKTTKVVMSNKIDKYSSPRFHQ